MQVSRFTGVLAVALSAGFIIAALPQASEAASRSHARSRSNSIVRVAMRSGNFKTLVKALQVAGLVGTLERGSYTVFAPDDKAFGKLPKSKLDELLKDRKQLREVLLYHVVAGRHPASSLTANEALKSVQGEKLIVNTKDGQVMVDGSLVTKGDINCSNGIIHVIDEVLMPGNATR